MHQCKLILTQIHSPIINSQHVTNPKRHSNW